MKNFEFNKLTFFLFTLPLLQLVLFLIIQNSGSVFSVLENFFYPYLLTISLPVLNLIGFLVIAFLYNTYDDIWDEAPFFAWLGIIFTFLLTSWASLQFFSDLTYVLSYFDYFNGAIILYLFISFFVYLSYLMLAIMFQDDDKFGPALIFMVSLLFYIFGTPWFISLIQF